MSSKALSILHNRNDSSLEKYLLEVSKIKLLSPEEESKLAYDFFDNKNPESAQSLVISHLPLVVKVAYSFKGYGLGLPDMISEGNIGLMKAVSKFDPRKGFRLSTYALWWIKAYITDYILNSWSLVKQGTTLARKKLFFTLSKIKNKLNITSSTLGTAEASKIAQNLDVTENDVHSINSMVSSRDLYMSANTSSSSELTLEDTLVSEELNPETVITNKQEDIRYKKLVQLALPKLPEREKYIIEMRHLVDDEKPKSLADLSEELGISRERVRQLEASAFKKIKNTLSAEMVF